jgi:hypothetical protein
MVDVAELADQRDFVNGLLYGDGGTGKTTALAHAANLGKVLYIDAEAGLKRRPLTELGVDVSNVKRLRTEETGLTFTLLEDTFWQIKAELDDDPEAWVGVFMDSGTEVYHALIDSLVVKRVDKYTKLKEQGKVIADSMADRFFVDRDDYGVMSEQVRFLMRRFRDLSCHFGASFLERRDQDKETAVVRVGPSVTPGLQSDLVGWFDIVGRTTYDPVHDLYIGTFRPEGVRQGKDRYGVLPRRMVDPTFDRIVEYVEGKLTEATDPKQRVLQNGEEELAQETAGTAKGNVGLSALQKARAQRASATAGRGKE